MFSVGFFLWFLSSSTQKAYLIPNFSQSIAESIYKFIADLLKEQVGLEGRPYFPIIFTTFTFILSSNLVGMIPYAFTTTSHLVITFALSVSIFIGVTVVGFKRHGIDFLSFLLPPGAPLALAPLIVLIELISYVFRVLSLSVRLFANMMSGHALLKILISFSWIAFSQAFLSVSGAILAIVFCVMVLESGIAFVQAYVFTVLVCLYLKEGLYLH
jgi:ATP synthase subunit 6